MPGTLPDRAMSTPVTAAALAADMNAVATMAEACGYDPVKVAVLREMAAEVGRASTGDA